MSVISHQRATYYISPSLQSLTHIVKQHRFTLAHADNQLCQATVFNIVQCCSLACRKSISLSFKFQYLSFMRLIAKDRLVTINHKFQNIRFLLLYLTKDHLVSRTELFFHLVDQTHRSLFDDSWLFASQKLWI